MQAEVPNFVDASGPLTHNLNDTQLPAYFHEYTTHFIDASDTSRIDASFIGLLPTNREGVRILNLEAGGELHPIVQRDGSVSYLWTIVWEIANIQVFRTFTLYGALEGVLNITPSATTLNAGRYISYDLNEERRELYTMIDLRSFFTNNRVEPFGFNFTLMIQDDFVPYEAVRLAYLPYNFPYQYTGRGQTVMVTAYLNAGYLLEDIVSYLRTQGIMKTTAQLATQITYRKATALTSFFYNGTFYPIPRSDGYLCNPPLTELQSSCMELSMNLQFIFSMTPDVNVVIVYYGCDCDPNTGTTVAPVESEMELVAFLQSNMNLFDVVSDSYHHLDPTLYTQTQRDQYRVVFNGLYASRKTVFTASGNLGEPEPDFWNSLKYVISCGGLVRIFNDAFQREQVCWPQSSGGFYTNFVPFDLPEYQVGFVPILYEGTTKLIGVPCVGGLADGLLYVYNGQGTRVRSQIAGTSCVPPVMSALVCMINEATEYKRWPYVDILYLEFDYLFTYVNKGANKTYNASDYVNWNPITGLGWIDGTRLLQLLKPISVRSGDKLCISSRTLQNRMSFLNFYPPSPFYDPYIRQPVFGPKCYWSYLSIYRVNPTTNTLDTNPTPLADGDVVAVFSALPFDLYWILTYNRQGYVELQRYTNVVEPSMKWVLTMEENVWYAPFNLSPFAEPLLFLSSKFSPPTPESSPSVTMRTLQSDFVFRRHSWFLANEDLYATLITSDVSFYMNVANLNYFMSSTYDEATYKDGRRVVGTSDVVVSYEFFTPEPEFVVIPLTYQQKGPVPDVALMNNASYMFFNIRIQAYVTVNPSYILQFVNVHKDTSGPYQYLYDSCAFLLSNTQDTFQNRLFEPSLSGGPLYVGTPGATSSAARYNDFIFLGTMKNVSGYVNLLTSYVSTNPDNSSGIIDLNTLPSPPPSLVTLTFYDVDPAKIFSMSTPSIWLRQCNEPAYSFYNNAIAPDQTFNGLPYMQGYFNGVVEQGFDTGSWRLTNSFGSPDTRIRDTNLGPMYYYTDPSSSFSFRSYTGSPQYLVNLTGNPSQWQPQMLTYNGQDPIGYWRLQPFRFSDRGPPANYVYTTGLYLIRNVATNKYLSVIMDLGITPSMLDPVTKPSLLNVTNLCIYTPRNDNYVPTS